MKRTGYWDSLCTGVPEEHLRHGNWANNASHTKNSRTPCQPDRHPHPNRPAPPENAGILLKSIRNSTCSHAFSIRYS
ncbi:MAG TPA: hypothetical protein VF658_01630 [Pyrinomonadaceae bacterium]